MKPKAGALRSTDGQAGFAEGGRALVLDHTQGEAGQDRCQGRQPWPLCHLPIGRGCGAEGAVPKNPPPHRWAAAGPFTAMTAAHPIASRSPDRTGLCRAGRSAPSQCEMVTGPGFSSPNQPDQERTTAYRDSSGPNSRSDAHCATIVGEWEEPSGESRMIPQHTLARRTNMDALCTLIDANDDHIIAFVVRAVHVT